jgi:predicted nucleotidyltransferase
MMLPRDSRELELVCRRYGVRRLSLFGSAVRGELQPDSDVDFLVEYDPSKRPGMVEMQELADRLSALYGGRKVDLVNPKYLNPRLKTRILAEAQLTVKQFHRIARYPRSARPHRDSKADCPARFNGLPLLALDTLQPRGR